MESLTALEMARISDDVEADAFIAMWEAAPAALREQLGLRIERIADAVLLLAPGLPSPMFNRAIGLGLRQPASVRKVQAIAEVFRAAGCKNWWLHWNPQAQPGGFDQEIEALGFTLPKRRTWAKMLRGPEPPPAIATDLRIAPATPDQASEVARIAVLAFEMPPFMSEWFQGMRSGPWRVYAVIDGSTVAGGGWLYRNGASAWLGIAAVAPSHRKRGGQGALMARRIADAAAAGALHIVTETGEPTAADEPNPSLANMRRCGFTTVASRLNYAAPAN